jgi:hypothetical protein
MAALPIRGGENPGAILPGQSLDVAMIDFKGMPAGHGGADVTPFPLTCLRSEKRALKLSLRAFWCVFFYLTS